MLRIHILLIVLFACGSFVAAEDPSSTKEDVETPQTSGNKTNCDVNDSEECQLQLKAQSSRRRKVRSHQLQVDVPDFSEDLAKSPKTPPSASNCDVPSRRSSFRRPSSKNVPSLGQEEVYVGTYTGKARYHSTNFGIEHEPQDLMTEPKTPPQDSNCDTPSRRHSSRRPSGANIAPSGDEVEILPVRTRTSNCDTPSQRHSSQRPSGANVAPSGDEVEIETRTSNCDTPSQRHSSRRPSGANITPSGDEVEVPPVGTHTSNCDIPSQRHSSRRPSGANVAPSGDEVEILPIGTYTRQNQYRSKNLGTHESQDSVVEPISPRGSNCDVPSQRHSSRRPSAKNLALSSGELEVLPVGTHTGQNYHSTNLGTEYISQRNQLEIL